MKRVIQLALVFLIVCQSFVVPVAGALEENSTSPAEMSEQSAEEADSSIDAPVPPTESPETPIDKELPSPFTGTLLTDEAEDPPLVLPSLIINRVVAGLSGQTLYEYIELYNPSAQDITVDSWHVTVLRKDNDSKQEVTLKGTVKANGYVLLAGTDSQLDSFDSAARLKSNIIVTTGGIVRLTDTTNAVIEELRWGDTASPSLTLATGSALERIYTSAVPSVTGDNLKDFNAKVAMDPPRGGGYEPYVAPINQCSGVVISEIAANVADEAQFVELYNTSGGVAVLDGCLLQTNRSLTKTFTLTGALNPGEYRAISITSTGLTLTKTTSGVVYLLSSDASEETDSRSYDGLAEGTSWSWFGESDWRQTFSPSPNAASIWQKFLPCEPGYERNLETGRCYKITAPAQAVECSAGKYRNPDTNRCRSVETADVLTPCKEGQVRNPETNRCRSLASVASTLVPCKEGQERNPDTNRCRNIAGSVPDAAFAVEPIADTGKAFAGWWALGGVGVLAAGYGAWEWRREVINGIRKIGSFFTGGK